MGWLIALAVLTVLGAIPVGISLRYEKEKFGFQIRLGFLTFSLPKGKKKEKSAKKQPEAVSKAEETVPQTQKTAQPEKAPETEKAETGAVPSAQPPKKKTAGTQPEEAPEAAEKAPPKAPSPPQKESKPPFRMKDYLPFLHLAVDFLGSLRRKLRIEKLFVKVILAGDDPCSLAQLYGMAWAGASELQALLNRIFVVQDQDLDLRCDFTAEKTVAEARVDLTLTIGRILSLAVGFGIRALKEYMIFKKRKGGAKV